MFGVLVVCTENRFCNTVMRALSGCRIEDNPVLRAGRTWAQAARVMSFQESKASLRAARYERGRD